jgi:hypothetical protein
MRRGVTPLLVLLAFGVGIAAGAYLTGGEQLSQVRLSPDGRERLELYYPDRWHRFLNPNGDLYVFARVTRVPEEQLLGTSPPFEMSGAGPVEWTRSGVEVGTAATWDRATGRWAVD